MNLQGPFQLPSLSFCDHIRPLRLGSLSAAEHSLHWGVGKQGEQGAQARGSCRVPQAARSRARPPAESPRQPGRAGAEGRGPGVPPPLPLPRKLRPAQVGLAPPSLSLPISPYCIAGFPESSWWLLSKVQRSGPQSRPLFAPTFLLARWLGTPLRVPEFGVGTDATSSSASFLLPWLCRHERSGGFPPHADRQSCASVRSWLV